MNNRKIEAWADRLIATRDLHRANEDGQLAGDFPYYDVCQGLVGDGHIHLSPDWPFRTGWEPTKREPEKGE